MGREIRLALASLVLFTGCGLSLDAAPPRADAAVVPGLDAAAPPLDAALDSGPPRDTGPHDAGRDAVVRPDAAEDAGHLDAPGDAFVPDPCAGLSSGDECSADPRRICVDGLCVPSTCGDGVIDAHEGEDCEPADPTSDPACVDCRYECTVGDECATDTPCLLGRCEANRCTYENAADRTPCPSPAEPLAVCVAGFCVSPTCGDGRVEGDEECDVGTTASAGCTACRFACRTNTDCSDGDPCNGEEACVDDDGGRLCGGGTAVLVCEPGPCETGQCVTGPDGAAACEYTLLATVDADGDGYPSRTGCDLPVDCDDGNPDVNPGALEICASSGVDVDDDCNPATVGGTLRRWCPDEDGDRYGSMDDSRSIESCAPPVGVSFAYTLDCTDCFDAGGADAAVATLVHPGQRTFYSTPYCSAGGGPCSFDYDCDGTPTLQFDEVETCRFLLGCANRDGWQDRVPGCGERHTWVTCRGLGACVEAESMRSQGCR